MRKDKRYIFFFLLFVNMVILMIPVVPHHHHSNGLICMKSDLATENCCTQPQHHHHSHNASCCSTDCITHFDSRIPSFEIDSSPNYVFVATLFTHIIIENLLRPQERRIRNAYVYRESLHGTNVLRAFGLRAPPCFWGRS